MNKMNKMNKMNNIKMNNFKMNNIKINKIHKINKILVYLHILKKVKLISILI